MKRFFSKKKHPKIEKVFDVFFDPTKESLHLRRVKTGHEITDRTVWRKLYNKRRMFIPAGIVVIVVVALTFALQGRANVAPFYATQCLGSWQGSQKATGEPQTDENTLFSEGNTARVSGSGELFCGGFVGTIPEDANADQAFIKLALARFLGGTRMSQSELIPIGEVIEGVGVDLLTVAYTLNGTTWIRAGVVRESDIFNGVVTLPIDEVYWDDMSSIQVRVTALESSSTLYLDAVWVEIAYESSLEDELAGLDIEGLEGVRTIGDDELDILKSNKRNFRATEEAEFEFEIPSVLPEPPDPVPVAEETEEDVSENSEIETTDEESPPEEIPVENEDVSAEPTGEDDETDTTSPQVWLHKARALLGARFQFGRAFAQTTSKTPLPRVVGFKLFDPRGRAVDADPQITHAGNKLRVTLPEQKSGLHPGKYRMQVTIMQGDVVFVSTQDFFWGVLAINLNKSTYQTGEEAYVQMAALNNGGSTLCDADLELIITDPKGSSNTYKTRNNSIISSDTCGADNVTDHPDYFLHHILHHAGTYTTTLTNRDTGHSIDDSFEVRDVLPYSVERIGATRINPFRAEYEMQILVTAHEDFKGTITERVPTAFSISSHTGDQIRFQNNEQQIVWNKKINEGETHILTYTYQAPEVSPELFLVGPVTLTGSNIVQSLFGRLESSLVFEEARQWQLASDAVGDIGHWQDSIGGQIPGTTFAAFEFDAEIRNDGIYTRPNDSTIELDEAGDYLIISTIRGTDSSNGRYNAQARVAQTFGSGTLFTSYYTGYSRDNSEPEAWFRAVGVLLNADANSQIQIQRRRDTDTPTSGSVADQSDVQVVRINPTNYGVYAIGGTSGAYGGTTPNTVDITAVTSESDTNAIQGNTSTETVTVKGDNKRYLIAWSVSGDTGGSRTQRIGHLEYDGTDDLATRSYCYQRNSSNEYCGLGSMDILETATADRAIQVEVYRGDGVSADQGGADVDGSWDVDGNGQMVVLELPDSAEVFRSHDGTGVQDVTSSLTLNAMRTVDFNDSSSFTQASVSAMNVINAADVFAWANVWTARNNVSSGSRLTAYGRITVNGVETIVGEHGNYTRGNQGTQDTFAGSFHPAGIFAVGTDGHDIGVNMDPLSGTEGGGTDRTQAGTVGFFAINLDTLTATGNTAPIISTITLNGGNDIVLNEGTFVIATTTITASDADGCNQLTGLGNVEATLYRAPTTTAGTTCTPDDNNCYSEFISCTATTTGNTCGASPDTEGEFDCSFRLWYITDPTDSGTFAGDIWALAATATDGAGASGTATNTGEIVEVLTLQALDVTVQGADISYGTVNPTEDTGSVNQIATTTNTGNSAIDSEISGDIMCANWPTCSGSVIQPTFQQFSTTTFTFGSGQNLTATASPATVELDLAKPTATTTAVEDELYWGIRVPIGSQPGSYEGQNLFTAVAD